MKVVLVQKNTDKVRLKTQYLCRICYYNTFTQHLSAYPGLRPSRRLAKTRRQNSILFCHAERSEESSPFNSNYKRGLAPGLRPYHACSLAFIRHWRRQVSVRVPLLPTKNKKTRARRVFLFLVGDEGLEPSTP